jgi:hypothetical protein
MGGRIKLERGEMVDAIDYQRSGNKGREIASQDGIVEEDWGHSDTRSSR